MSPKAAARTPEEEEANDREWRRATTFDRDNERYWKKYREHVAEGKPTLDYIAMMGATAICTTVFFLAINEMLLSGWADRQAIIAVIAFFIFGHLLSSVTEATTAQVARLYLRVLYRSGAPHPTEWDSQTLRNAWAGFIVGSGMVVMAAVGLVGWEFAKAARMIGEPKKATISRPAAAPAQTPIDPNSP